MRVSRRVLLPIVALAVVLGGAFGFAPIARGQAQVPTLEVGDSVGYGTHIDLATFLDPILDMLREMDAMDPTMTINELEASGSFDVWTVEEVTEKTDTLYTIRSETATGVEIHFLADVTGSTFPAAGTYQGTLDPYWGWCTYPSIPQETRTLRVDVDLTLLETTVTTSKLQVADLAITESTTDEALDLRATVIVENMPDIQENETTCVQTVAYDDLDLTITAAADNQYRLAFTPPLDLFDFPINDGEVWNVTSEATLAGTVSGTVDVQGLDPEDETRLFDELNDMLSGMAGISVAGLDEFPIVLEELTVVIGTVEYLSGGVLHDIPIPIDLQFQATESQMTLADGQFHTVYELEPVIAFDPGMELPVELTSFGALIYSPDDGTIVGYSMAMDGTMGLPVFELRNVPVDEAQANLEDTQQSYAVGPGGIVGFVKDLFLKAPYWGILIVAAVIILVAALAVRGSRRKRAAMPPPGAPGLGPPSPPPPPPPPIGPP